MDDIFGDVTNTYDQWMDSINEHSVTRTDSTSDQQKTTTFEKVFDVSPIKKSSTTDDSVYNFDNEFSFDKSRSVRKYFPSRRSSLHFSPVMGSTPKPAKTRIARRRADPKSESKIRRKSRKRLVEADTSLWEKAMNKSPELTKWIDSFNEEMKKIESTDLSVTKSSLNDY